MTHPSDISGRTDDERPEEAVETVEAYEDDGRVVLYDAESPLAWIEATIAVSVPDFA